MLKNWITYYLFLLSSLVFALLYPGRVSSAFFYALLLMPPISLILSALLLAGFRYEQFMDRMSATKGDTVNFRLTARNKGLLMLPYVEASFYGEGCMLEKDFKIRRMAVLPLNKATHDISISCRYKGAFEVGIRQIKFRDYLGLFTFRQNISKLGNLVVYPKIVPIDGFPVMAGYSEKSQASAGRSHDRTENISDIRKYVSGDRLRSVHWKLSAKKDELMVKNFEQASGACVDVILDAYGSTVSMESILLEDKLVECAVALAYHFTKRSIPATLYYYGNELIRQGLNNMGDFRLAYSMLAEASFGRESKLQDLARLVGEGAKRKTVAIIAPCISHALCGEALRLISRGCMVSIIHIRQAAPENKTEEGADPDNLKASLLNAGVFLYAVGLEGDINAALARRAV